MDSISFAVDGRVVPWARAGRRGGFSYTPTHVRKYQDWVKVCASQAMQGRAPIEGPIGLDVRFRLPIPDSWPAWKREAAGQGHVRPTARPDLDNLLKSIEDACNLIVWKDDAQIVDITVTKAFHAKPAVLVDVEPIEMIASAAEWKQHLQAQSRVPLPGRDLFAA